MVDSYKLMLYKSNGSASYDITQLIGNLSWKDNLDTLGTELTFDKANSDEKYYKYYDFVELGDKLLLTNNGTEVFRGIITDESIEARFGRSYTAYDYMYYFNKSKIEPKQFNKQSASKAIESLCNAKNVPIYKIASMNTLVSGIYKDKTFAEILNDILDKATAETGIKYKAEMIQGKLHIAKYSDLFITATYNMSSNTAAFDVTKAIGSISKTRSIAGMSNKIIVTSEDENNTKVYATVSDSNSIDKYGLLQMNVSLSAENLPKAYNIAKNKLTELSKISEDTSIELLGNDAVKSGRIISITEPITKLSGQYLVKDVTHTYSNGIHKMSLNIESW